jgi:sulfide:quinone oxidoreductase
MKKKQLLILGGGTSGNIFSHRFPKELNMNEWDITVVDKSPIHYYQPGFLFIPFGIYKPEDVVKNKSDLLHPKVNRIFSEIDRILPNENIVRLIDGIQLRYDYLIIGTGVNIAPDEVDGMKGELWGREVLDFYTYDGAVALQMAMKNFRGGNLVIHVTEMPIKCPVAPLEFAFLSDDYFKRIGIRADTHILYVTPLSGAFTKEEASSVFGNLLNEKNIHIHTEFNIAAVDNKSKEIISWDNRKIPFDLLVTVPTNMGSEMIKRSGIGDELNLIPTNPNTLKANHFDNIFVGGDASDIPTSKAGSVIHFQSEVIIRNLLALINDRPMQAEYHGHSNCFIETGNQKAILIDFDYQNDPTIGKFPIPSIGPLSLLKETRLNHLGKMAFKWIYWSRIIRGKDIPFTS